MNPLTIILIKNFSAANCSVPVLLYGSVTPNTAVLHAAVYTLTCNAGYTLVGEAAVTCNDGVATVAANCLGD